MSKNDKIDIAGGILILVGVMFSFAFIGWPDESIVSTPDVHPTFTVWTDSAGVSHYEFEDGSVAGLIDPATPSVP